MSRQEEQRSPSPGVAAEVRDFYERYPYPRPIDSLEKYRRLGQDRQKRRADYHLVWPVRPYSGDHSILVAGCGTSQAAKHALRWPAAQVTGIDFSATSVRCTEQLKRKYNLDNLEVRQLPIERVSDLKMSFDHIVCTGVLHHLADPDAGLRSLRDVLKPDGGAIHVMVYAPYGRAGIYMLQEFCRRIGIHANDEEIRDLITTLTALPSGHPLENLLRQAPDLRQEAALADALLNPKDCSYSVPQLFDFIERAGLTFGRWVKQAPYIPHCGIAAKIPQASRMAQLPFAEQYAAVELFRGTMVRHSVVAYRDDSPGGVQQISFDGDAWLGYVPLRMPDTICVEERLPPGADGVLINQTHAYRDLILPIDSTEKRMFDAIDGSCSIAGIVERAFPSLQTESQLDMARTFFEKLWWHDQVVFDASRSRLRKEDA
ncbi:MAG TPA: class I SAM-dependent methyltransferase [Woeseiaceae bacterium]|nr:class I SAM-dependent methyltransferase [Woeseiaceae bacterium]